MMLSNYVAKIIRDVPIADRITYPQYRSLLKFNQNKIDEYDEADADNFGDIPEPKKIAKVSSFAKTESYPKFKHLRWINSRSTFAKVYLGPLMKAIENVVYNHFFDMDHCPFIKHTPVPERPQLVRNLQSKLTSNMYAYLSDFTAFESQFPREVMLAVECQLYEHCLSWYKHAHYAATCISGVNKLRMRNGVKAECEARRMSGDMCTSLGNGFTNFILLSFLVAEKGGTRDCYVEGDDGIFITTVPVTKDDYADLGFSIKLVNLAMPGENNEDYANSVLRAAFCGLVMGSDNIIIRDPRSFLSKFGWTHSFMGAGAPIMDGLLRGKALSAYYETPQCPIVGSMIRYALNKTSGAKLRLDDLDHYKRELLPDEDALANMEIAPFAPSMESRLVMNSVFNIPVETQIAVEKLIESGDFDHIHCILPPESDMFLYCQNYLVLT